ncbi:hypothetical protein AVEN_12332-1 [Araneus ventricosus]|uniref:Uncharacterized protein n=1 Tax=Araneus ventricosus TaxID=182803 RepID=A0A4Y2KX04_ARAVE|nr:hypothetical protein AVEN_12332-1 [Araneus ventricosus]
MFSPSSLSRDLQTGRLSSNPTIVPRSSAFYFFILVFFSTLEKANRDPTTPAKTHQLSRIPCPQPLSIVFVMCRRFRIEGCVKALSNACRHPLVEVRVAFRRSEKDVGVEEICGRLNYERHSVHK